MGRRVVGAVALTLMLAGCAFATGTARSPRVRAAHAEKPVVTIEPWLSKPGREEAAPPEGEAARG